MTPAKSCCRGGFPADIRKTRAFHTTRRSEPAARHSRASLRESLLPHHVFPRDSGQGARTRLEMNGDLGLRKPAEGAGLPVRLVWQTEAVMLTSEIEESPVEDSGPGQEEGPERFAQLLHSNREREESGVALPVERESQLPAALQQSRSVSTWCLS